jgi:hypothetical protein
MLTATDLYSLEEYSRQRPDFRARALAHRKARQVLVGDHVTLSFEDRLTIQYQIQEMLRIEKAFEAAAIQDELDAYNPLIPTGRDLCATMMIEYGDAEIRRQQLVKLAGIEHRVYLRVQGHEPVFAHADEDLERGDDTKTSAVHFLRWCMDDAVVASLRSGAKFIIGIDHEEYESSTEITHTTREQLVGDFA